MNKNILENGDMIFDNGNLTAVGDKEDIKNELACVFNTWKEEWFLNPDMGIDYETFFDKRTSEERQRMIILDGISQVERVNEVRDIKISVNDFTRQAEVYIEVVINGQILSDVFALGGD